MIDDPSHVQLNQSIGQSIIITHENSTTARCTFFDTTEKNARLLLWKDRCRKSTRDTFTEIHFTRNEYTFEYRLSIYIHDIRVIGIIARHFYSALPTIFMRADRLEMFIALFTITRDTWNARFLHIFFVRYLFSTFLKVTWMKDTRQWMQKCTFIFATLSWSTAVWYLTDA